MELPLGLGVASPDVVLDGVDPRLMAYVEHLGMVHQILFGRQLIITSGKEGEHVQNSFHKIGRALDLRTIDKEPDEVIIFLSIIAFSAPSQGIAVFDERATHDAKHVHLELHGG
jgi:hypothetical protein